MKIKTVGDLIEALQKYPLDEPIYVRDLANPDSYPVLGVSPYDADEERNPDWALAVEYDTYPYMR